MKKKKQDKEGRRHSAKIVILGGLAPDGIGQDLWKISMSSYSKCHYTPVGNLGSWSGDGNVEREEDFESCPKSCRYRSKGEIVQTFA